MSAPPYQKFFWGSYYKHTPHLGHAREHGAYLLLLGALWNHGGKLPCDDDVLAGYAMLSPKEWAAVKPKLMPLFRVSRGWLTQPRVTEDLAKYRDTSGKRKQAGKLGGMVSAGKRCGKSKASAIVLPTKPEPEPKKGSEDKSSGVEPTPDLDKIAWDSAVLLLRDQGGMAEKPARSFFGRLLSENRIEARDLLPAVTQAVVNRTQEPAAYLRRSAAGVASRRANREPQRRVAFV